MRNAVLETTVPHTELAAQLLAKVRALPEGLDGFTFARIPVRQKLNASKSVPAPFLEAAAFLMEGSAALAAAAGIPVAALRDVVELERAFAPVLLELQEIARAIEYTLALRKAAVGKAALDVYSVARRLITPETDSALYAHVTDMAAALGRTGKRKKPLPDTEKTASATQRPAQAA
ncbi:MAG TPA: hypothetical protein VGF69_05200 [Thermoanaerobaculia bacterium]|jgi:hypothetical protein